MRGCSWEAPFNTQAKGHPETFPASLDAIPLKCEWIIICGIQHSFIEVRASALDVVLVGDHCCRCDCNAHVALLNAAALVGRFDRRGVGAWSPREKCVECRSAYGVKV